MKENVKMDELYHYGVLGMKWGVRHDRSPTSSGRVSSKRKIKLSEDAKEAQRINKKHVSEMSNQELRRLNERQNLERQYYNMNPTTRKKAIKFIATTASTMGTVMTLYNNSDKLVKTGKKVGTKFIDTVGHIKIKSI